MKPNEPDEIQLPRQRPDERTEVMSPMVPSSSDDAFARTLLDMASRLEQEESRIKRSVLQALDAGNIAQGRNILERWLEKPVSEVLGPVEGEATKT